MYKPTEATNTFVLPNILNEWIATYILFPSLCQILQQEVYKGRS